MEFIKDPLRGQLSRRYELERDEKWEEIVKGIPDLRFKSTWGVKIIPPWMGATARFYITTKEGCSVSVYLDHYGRLGAMEYPYYELYPDADDDTARFGLNEPEALIKAITKSLAKQKRNKKKEGKGNEKKS